MSTRVFISWSGKQSQYIASTLRDWLPYLGLDVDPFVSSRDIKAGMFWDEVIRDRAKTSKFCIVCLTATNSGSPWLHYEAGAMAEGFGIRVAPYLFGSDVDSLSGPLTRLQAKSADADGTWDLVESLADAVTNAPRLEILKNAFNKNWPDIEAKLKRAPAPDTDDVDSSDGSLSYVPLNVADETVEQLIQKKLDYISTSDTILFAQIEEDLRLPPGSAKRVFERAAAGRFDIVMAPDSVRVKRIHLPAQFVVSKPNRWGGF